MLDLIQKLPHFGPGRCSLYTLYRRVYRPSKQWSKPGYMKPYGKRTKGYAEHGNGKRR